jgi:lipopolysaccharide/colanic/teichoic acid biosynthesis glycosyltransferase
MGLPLITTDTPGCRDVVEDGVNGFLVPARDSAALGRAMLRLLTQPDLRQSFGRHSRRRAVSRFDLALIVEQTHTLYQQLLTCRKRQGDKVTKRVADKLGENGTRTADGDRSGSLSPCHPVTLSPCHPVKRLLDVLIAGIALVLTGPLLLIGALAVKLTSRGPAFYRARRTGRGGQPFDMFKLRTMRVGTDTPERKITADRDERVTPAGRLLRRFKIDELPQFWNVLRGDMSLVGPRPEDWDIVQQHYTADERRTLAVRPGIASPADVRWYPDLTYHDPPPPGVPIQEHYLRRHLHAQLAVALDYVERQSLLADLEVVVQLVFCVLVRSWLPPPKRPLPPGNCFPVDRFAPAGGEAGAKR